MADSNNYMSTKNSSHLTRSIEKHTVRSGTSGSGAFTTAKVDMSYMNESAPTVVHPSETNAHVERSNSIANDYARHRTLSEDRTTFRVTTITAPKLTVIQRSNATPLLSASRQERSYSNSVMSHVPSVPQQEVTAVLQTVQSAEIARDKEKRNLQDLNERLALYIEKSRFYEAQNRKAAEELRTLRDSWGKETARIKAMFEQELANVKKLLEDAENQRGVAEVRAATLEADATAAKQALEEEVKSRAATIEHFDSMNQKMADLEGESAFLRRKMETLDMDKQKLAKENAKLRDEIARVRSDLDAESIAHIKAENSAHCLREELEFMTQIWEHEKKELDKLAHRDTTGANREFWKSEVAAVFKELHEEFENQLGNVRHEMESHFSIKLQEAQTQGTKNTMELTRLRDESKRYKDQSQDLRNRLAELEPKLALLEAQLQQAQRELETAVSEREQEVARLRKQLNDAHNEVDQLIKEMKKLLDMKISLEAEISAYRKLLEMEENRYGDPKKLVAGVMATNMQSATNHQIVTKPEQQSKVRNHKAAKGNVEISDVSPDGKFVILQNIGRKDENLDGWKISRLVDNRSVAQFVFPKIILGPDKQTRMIRVWARGHKGPDASPNDLEIDEPSWGMGFNCVTMLYGPQGEERASHTTEVIQTK